MTEIDLNDTAIWGFGGKYRFLSNFWVERDGKTNEHRFQAAKALEPEQAAWVMNAINPGDAKQRGRVIKMRPDWESVKVDVMLNLLLEKFKDPALAAALRGTGLATLYEANTWHDTFWGVDKWTGNGQNQLGELLMEVRSRDPLWQAEYLETGATDA